MTGPTDRPEKIVRIDQIPPGIQRDGTRLASERWTDGAWVRWDGAGRFRKIGGYFAGASTITGPVRHLRLHWQGTSGYVHSFSTTKSERFTITAAGVMSAVSDRTPAGFTTSTNNNWQSAILYDEATGANVLLAHCTENLADIGTGTSRPVYYGDITTTAVLITTGNSCDGGIVVLQPYAFLYNSNGLIQWSDANQPTLVGAAGGGDAGEDRVTGAKIVRGFSVLDQEYVSGGGSGSVGLFWSLDSIIKASYVGGTAIFRFQTINAEEISVLSSNAIARHAGVFYWPGIDQFYSFTGGRVGKVPNDVNINWFFENLNYTQRQKVWNAVNERWGEIWWFFPSGSNTECDSAIVFNAHETQHTQRAVWYDVTLARSAGDRGQNFRYPIWTDTSSPATVYFHESGVDAIDAASVSTAISSYVDTPVFTPADNGFNNWLLLKRVEHDMTQVGNVTMTVYGREYARSSDTTEAFTVTTTTTKTDLMKQYRQMRIRFASNAVLGNMASGKILAHMQVGTGQ